MKKLILSILLLIPVGLMSISAGELSPRNKNNEPAGTVKILKMPFASVGKTEMELVFRKGAYSLWRCEESFVDKYPTKSLTGVNYRYFVYKNEKYHLAVKENNKDDIFGFFSGKK